MKRDPSSAYAPAAAAILGVLMLAVVLPNPFYVPADRSPASAEYAPIPGRAPEHAANFTATSAASSNTIGDGSGPGAIESAPGALPVFSPRMKECVGDPPRQTEDPMSPPCVPFFDGPNGGATWQGVTEDRVEVLMYVENLDHEIDLSKPWKPTDETRESDDPLNEARLARTLKAHYRYFQQRYQTYGRQVYIRAIPADTEKPDATGNPSRASPTCADRRSTARETVKRGPFAVAHVGYWGARCFRQPILEEQVPFFGMNYDVARQEYQDHAPFLWGFFPDRETSADLSASFMCRSLKNGTARFARDPLLHDVKRRFAALHPTQTSNGWVFGPEHKEMAIAVVRASARCDLDIERYPTTGWDDVMVRLKQRGFTTLLCRCPGQAITQMQNQASSIGYYPEWFWEQPTTVMWYGQLFADRKQTGFGIVPRWRHPAFREQVHFRAYQRMEPGTTPNPTWSAEIYYTMHTLFSAIQTAGPNLTPGNIQRGMFTLNLLRLDDPWVPTGGWGHYGPHAVNPYAFIDTAMGWWGDFTGAQPGGAPGEGCFRASLEGRRFFDGEWPRGDRWLYGPDDPCFHGDIAGPDDG